MRKQSFILSFLLLLLCTSEMRAQWDVPFSHYWAVRGYYNPSFAGETEQIRTAGAYRYQWTGLQDAPTTVIAMADMPFDFLGQRHGVGIVTVSQHIGQARNTLLAGQYVFRKKMGKGTFGIGIQAGLYELNFDAGSIHTAMDTVRNKTMVRANKTEKKSVDINAGLSWSGKNFFAGISAMHLTQPSFYAQPDTISSSDIRSDSITSHIPRQYNFIASCNITLFRPLEIQPMALILSDFKDTYVQATLRMVYNNKFSGGASWIKNDGYVFFAGAVIQGIEAGYTFNWHTSGIGKESKGSHEVYVRYNLPFDLFRQQRQPHKSIRLL